MSNSVKYSQLRGGNSKRMDLASAVPLSHPLSIYVEPTNICNFRCTFCPESLDEYKEKAGGLFRMTEDQFARVCSEIGSLGKLKVLNLYLLGEPLANRSLSRFIQMAKSANVADRVSITSNASLLTREKSAEIVASGLDYIRFSIYAANENRMRVVTGSTVSLARLVENVRVFREIRDSVRGNKPFIYAKMIDSQDPDENARFISLFQPLVDEAAIEPVMDWDGSIDHRFSNISTERLLATEYFRFRKKACPFAFYSLVIHSDLKVSVCCVDWAKNTVVGDLSRESLVDIWRGNRLHTFRMTHLRGERDQIGACAKCTFLHTTPDYIDTLTPDEFERRRTLP